MALSFATRGLPKHIRSDNGPEFFAQAIQDWLFQLEVETLYIEPGSPWENAYVESFNSQLRNEFLALEIFVNLTAAKHLIASYRRNDNENRPHSSRGYQTPGEFARQASTNPRSHKQWYRNGSPSPHLRIRQGAFAFQNSKLLT